MHTEFAFVNSADSHAPPAAVGGGDEGDAFAPFFGGESVGRALSNGLSSVGVGPRRVSVKLEGSYDDASTLLGPSGGHPNSYAHQRLGQQQQAHLQHHARPVQGHLQSRTMPPAAGGPASRPPPVATAGAASTSPARTGSKRKSGAGADSGAGLLDLSPPTPLVGGRGLPSSSSPSPSLSLKPASGAAAATAASSLATSQQLAASLFAMDARSSASVTSPGSVGDSGSLGGLLGEVGDSDDEEHPDEKRKRNSAASARFRLKKKLKEQRLEFLAKEMTDRAENMQLRVRSLEAEVAYLKDLLTMRNTREAEVGAATPLTASASASRRSSGNSNAAASAPPSSSAEHRQLLALAEQILTNAGVALPRPGSAS